MIQKMGKDLYYRDIKANIEKYGNIVVIYYRLIRISALVLNAYLHLLSLVMIPLVGGHVVFFSRRYTGWGGG